MKTVNSETTLNLAKASLRQEIVNYMEQQSCLRFAWLRKVGQRRRERRDRSQRSPLLIQFYVDLTSILFPIH